MRFLGHLFAVFLSIQTAAWADERITNFVSEAQVNADASIDVTENISIIAEGREINHGILRDFPTTYTDRNGIRVIVGFDVLSVERDGRGENYAIENLSNGRRIRIGSGDIWVSRGLHTYAIRYRTTRQLGFFQDYDELYWNVTGNGWTFPIDQATAIVRLPSAAKIIQHHAYTGYQGEDGSDARVINGTGNEYTAVTTRSFAPGEGLTVAVAWQKGVVAPPTDVQKQVWFLRDNAGLIGLVATLLAVAAYFFYAWTKVGRDPPAGTIIPLFAPPASVGPAAARYIWKHKFDGKAFAASLVGLAVKGRLKISETSGDFAITKKAAQGAPLTKAENTLYGAIPTGTTALENTNHVSINRMKSALRGELAREIEGSVFLRNTGWFMAGTLLSIAGLLISVFLMPIGGWPHRIVRRRLVRHLVGRYHHTGLERAQRDDQT